MKIVAVDGGRILDLVPTEEFRSPAGTYFPQLIGAIAAKYEFLTVPTNFAEAVKAGLKFEHGRAVIDGQQITIKELGIYSDGIICDAYDTRYADLVLDDFTAWAPEALGTKERISPVRRTYTSAIVCIFEKSVESGLGKFSNLCEMLSRSLNDSYGWDYTFNLFRLGFNVDPKTIPHLRSTNFVLERRAETLYTENRYFSVAPLKTETHIDLLKRIESELLA